MRPPFRTPPRGFSLLEVMIAFAILLVGLLPLLKLQVWGMRSNAGARAHTVAVHLASELAAGLEGLAFADPLLDVTEAIGPTPPATFTSIVDGGGTIVESGAWPWQDSKPIPGVRSDATIAREYGTDDAGKPFFHRRWRVYGYSPASGGAATVKIIAVSVEWKEPAFWRSREVVIYAESHNASAFLSGLTANQ